MEIRYSANPRDVARYTTEQLRREFLITGLYRPDEVVAVYSHVDRMVTLGILPVGGPVPLDAGIDVWHSFGTQYFLQRREVGFFNLGGPGRCTVDGTGYRLGHKDCLYITMGAQSVVFESDSADAPAKFYGVSAPAQRAYETRLLTIADAAQKPLGTAQEANRRVIYQFIHPDVLSTCQLMMGLTILEPGSVWNTMPAHTHERRMEVYTYFDLAPESVVFHMMGTPGETRHLVVREGQAVISPSWSIHSGCGVGSYSFIWAMGGENQAFDDMDVIALPELN